MESHAHLSSLCSDFNCQDFFRPVTGLPIHNYFPAFKFKWLYDYVEAVRGAVDEDLASFGTLDSWLMYKLTGGANGGIHVTDGGCFRVSNKKHASSLPASHSSRRASAVISVHTHY